MTIRLTPAGYKRELARTSSRGLVSAPAAVAVCLSQPGVSYTIRGQMAPLKLGVGDIKQATLLKWVQLISLEANILRSLDMFCN